MTVDYAGLEIGDGGSGPAAANISSITVVPEPSSISLVVVGLLGGLGIVIRRRK